jgi:hypothetical protein
LTDKHLDNSDQSSEVNPGEPDVTYTMSDKSSLSEIDEAERRRKELYYSPIDPPKKIKKSNLFGWLRLPVAFSGLVLAFWIALNLSSMLQSDSLADWFKNWSTNSTQNLDSYLGKGQIPTYEGVLSDTFDWVGEDSAGEPVTILSSELVPFDSEGETPTVITRLDAFADLEDCVSLFAEQRLYKILSDSETISDFPREIADVFSTYAQRLYNRIDCVPLE